MPSSWYEGATQYPVGTAGSYAGGPKKCVIHTTENDPDQTSAMDVVKWMAANKPGSVYHVIIHPIEHEIIQMLPASGSAKALSNPSGGVETNRAGSVVIQVSFVAYAREPFTRYPLPGWPGLRDWITSWGVPLTWAGSPPKGQVDHVSNTTWGNTSGWYGHCCVPENDHSDPGALDLNVLLGGGADVLPPSGSGDGSTSTSGFTLSFDGGAKMSLRYLKEGVSGGDVRSWQTLLNKKFSSGLDTDGDFGPKTASATKSAQSKMGIASDGVVGPQSLERAWER